VRPNLRPNLLASEDERDRLGYQMRPPL
jgi:hypothetical protein